MTKVVNFVEFFLSLTKDIAELRRNLNHITKGTLNG
jgi:hypothetical protein